MSLLDTLKASNELDLIFENLYWKDLSVNPFYTTEYKKLDESFHDTYILPMYDKSFKDGDEMESMFNSIDFYSKRQAFEVGFEAALKLMNKGGVTSWQQ